MQPALQPQAWHDSICSVGSAAIYDQEAYDKHVKMVRDTRIGVSVIVALAFIITAGGAYVIKWGSSGRRGGSAALVIAVIVLLCIEVPLFTAL